MARKMTQYPFFGAIIFITVCMLVQISVLSTHIINERNTRTSATAYEVAWQVVEVSRLVLATPPNHQIYSVKSLNNTALTTGNSYLIVTMSKTPKYQQHYSMHTNLLKLHDILLALPGPFRLSLSVTPSRWVNFDEKRVMIFPIIEMILLAIEIMIVISLWGWFIWKYKTLKPLEMLAKITQTLHAHPDNITQISRNAPIEVRDMATALIQLQEKVQSLLNDRALLLGLASHDIRAILTRLKMRTEMLDDEQQKMKLLNNIDEMNQLLDHLLEYSGEFQKQTDKKTTDLSQLLHTIVSQYTSKHKHIDTAHIGKNIIIQTNSTLLKLALNNIVSNAYKYGNHVCIQAHTSDTHSIITISDDGPGISSAEKQKVFTANYRGNTQKPGLGLGLTLAKNVILDMHGSIELKNNHPTGLKVIVQLPL